jgi:transaldolase / glucose-6-phosphate isomerase
MQANREQSRRGTAEETRPANPLRDLQKCGQSIWLDYIRRHLITSGELRRLVAEDGLRGVTSNPTIFEKALSGSTDYNDLFCGLKHRRNQDANAIYETLAIRDIQEAADILRQVYDQTERQDGYVSLEVSPYRAHDTRATMDEARRLWRAVGRENLMIKVPGTSEGIPAISQLIAEGINVNITLLFAREVYEKVARAYMDGLEALAARGGRVDRAASVASFFVSRIDTAVDARVEARIKAATSTEEQAELRALLGRVGIANAKLAYQTFKEIAGSPRWLALADRGARVQRLLWASTGMKNPNYRDVLYVEELIGPDTVNTMPPATMDAFRDHGRPRRSLEENVDEAHTVMRALAQRGLSMQEITGELLTEGIRLFSVSLDKLLGVIETKRKDALTCTVGRMTSRLPQHLSNQVKETLETWRHDEKVRRLWARDASLWTDHDESKWLDWLGVANDQRSHHDRFRSIAGEAREAGFKHAVLLGMGGSSLCPEVFSRMFGRQDGYPELLVLDSTDPAEVRAIEEKIDPAGTLFIVSSKSGTTLEANIFKAYFFDRMKQTVGDAEAGRHFIAITDPDSELERAAEVDRFRQVFHGVPGIGGRYSALSDFGLVPAAIMGLDVPRLLERTEEMVHACASCVPPADNPGVVLGATLGVLAREGRDKITLIASPGLTDFGPWVEQLLAESTGKDGKGLIPVDGEAIGPPEAYGKDRLFVYLRSENRADARQDAAVSALEQADQPIVRIAATDSYQLGQGFFRWEIATAVASAILGVNAFDQPDVEAGKIETEKLTAAYERTGALPAETPILRDGDIQLFADEKNALSLANGAGSDRSLRGYLREHLKRLQDGDYFALLAYVERNAPHEERLQAIRHAVRDARRVATCLGFGPRFLHSTGQVYKGGPNTGVFLQITCDDAHDLPVPGHNFTFGAVKAAQARGDFRVLAERNRRALRVHIGPDVRAGLNTLREAVREALE